MKVKTSEATGLQLDWGLSIALGHEKTAYIAECGSVHGRDKERGWTSVEHVNAYLCMKLMSKHEMDVTWGTSGKAFVQMSGRDEDKWHGGKTLPEAVARCVIAMRLGEVFEVPDELGVES